MDGCACASLGHTTTRARIRRTICLSPRYVARGSRRAVAKRGVIGVWDGERMMDDDDRERFFAFVGMDGRAMRGGSVCGGDWWTND